jgi:hypothetical protein
MKGKLTPEEAMAVQILSADPNWQKFKDYVMRKYLEASDDCETIKDDHRHHQGRALELKMMANIESKAENILKGT